MTTHLINEYWQLDSDSPSGLSWIKHRQYVSSSAPGKPACTSIHSGGYFYGRLGGRNYYAHRVVFYLEYGYWPIQVDHIDGNRTNNVRVNLRAATESTNQHNRLGRGYTLDRGKWKAQIDVGGYSRHLGVFLSEEEARDAYLTAKKKLHPTAPERCYAT